MLKNPFKWVFYPAFKMQIQPINPLKTVSKVGDLSSTIAINEHILFWCAIGHGVIGQERHLLWPDWLNWWV